MKETTNRKTAGLNQTPSFQFSKSGPVMYFESTVLRKYRFLTHAFCSRHRETAPGQFACFSFGSQEDKNTLSQNWEILGRAFNIEASQFLTVNQVHRDAVLVIDDPKYKLPHRPPDGYDAIITNQPGIAIGVKTADCVPIFLLDKTKRIIGVVHAGWRGTALKIAGKAVEVFREKFGSQPKDIHAVVGPAIRLCCYEVDDNVIRAIETEKKGISFYRPCLKKGKWMIDLPLANKFQLLTKGIHVGNISMLDLCTFCRTDIFFSYRAERESAGRQFNFMMLKK